MHVLYYRGVQEGGGVRCEPPPITLNFNFLLLPPSKNACFTALFMNLIVHVKWPNMYNLSTYCTVAVERYLSCKENDCYTLYWWVRVSVVIFGQLYAKIIEKTSF